jgi:outer membrane protein assembly factor BamB
MPRAIISLLSLCLLTCELPAANVPAYQPPQSLPPTGLGFRGDGTGVYPDSKPPIEFDAATGRNILWKAPLPNWGYNSPVPVGNRVLFISEPGWGSTWPELCCFDADTGTLVWKSPVNPLDAFPDLPPEKRQQLTDTVEAIYEQSRTAYRICSPLEALGGADANHPAVVAANKALAQHGMSIGGYKQGYGLLRQLRYTDDRNKKWNALMKPQNLKPECTWQRFGRARLGLAFCTPVTDGKLVWVMTYHGTVACFDVATGKRVWSAATGYTGHHGLMCSPRLYADLVITAFIDTNAFDPQVIAWDKTTGKVKWKVMATKAASEEKTRGSRPGGSLVVLRVGTTDVLLVSSGRVIRLPDGKLFDATIDKICGSYAIDDEHDVVFSTGHVDGTSMRTAQVLSIDGDKLLVKDRYALLRSYGPVSAVFTSGRLFTSLVQIDPQTGAWLGAKGDGQNEKNLPRSSPRTNHLLLAANGHVYGLAERKTGAKGKPVEITGVCEVYAQDGKQVSCNVLPAASREGDAAKKWLEQGWNGPSFSYCCAMNIGGDRLYICSDDMLYCIGKE